MLLLDQFVVSQTLSQAAYSLLGPSSVDGKDGKDTISVSSVSRQRKRRQTRSLWCYVVQHLGTFGMGVTPRLTLDEAFERRSRPRGMRVMG